MRVLLLGAYGTFGRRIFDGLRRTPDFELIAAGRDLARAQALQPDRAIALDTRADDFAEQVKRSKPEIVIHTAGPFEGQDYRVAEAAMAAGAHYIDLADGRGFVCGFAALDERARLANVLLLSGASSVPTLHAAAVDALSEGWREVLSIETGITPGNQTERGLATVATILAYVGKPFAVWHEGRWQMRFGWQDGVVENYSAPVGRRRLANCDIPDLALFTERYRGVQSVRFRAGLELGLLHQGLSLLSWLVRARLVPPMAQFARPLKAMSEWLLPFGSDHGAMHVRISGTDGSGLAAEKRFELVATNGDGPQIPGSAAVVIAGKLLRGEITQRGAMPCVGVVTLEEYLAALKPYSIEARFT